MAKMLDRPEHSLQRSQNPYSWLGGARCVSKEPRPALDPSGLELWSFNFCILSINICKGTGVVCLVVIGMNNMCQK